MTKSATRTDRSTIPAGRFVLYWGAEKVASMETPAEVLKFLSGRSTRVYTIYDRHRQISVRTLTAPPVPAELTKAT
jgi:hypothetical protein